MKNLLIKHFGPISKVEINFKRVTLLIGPQSSGKSTVLKVASFCAWIARKIVITQDFNKFCNAPDLIEHHLIKFHKLEGYLKKETYISYEDDAVKLVFNGSKCHTELKKGYTNYKRTKISYIPAERNLVAAIPNWYQVSMGYNNILNFMEEWEFARKKFTKGESIIGLPFSYKYNTLNKADKIIIENDVELDLVNASSGLQSLTPLFVMIKYLTEHLFKEKHTTVEDSILRDNLKNSLEQRLPGAFDKHKKIIDNFMVYYRSELFIEEPEAHLFPTTQKDFVYSLVDNLNVNLHRKHSCVISTHSPYLMTAFNNLIQAGETAAVSKDKERKIQERFPKRRRLRFDEVAAYSLQKGSSESIMDEDFKLISAEALDVASDEISEDFNFLLEA